MRYRPLPGGTVRFGVAATGLLAIWLAWGSFRYPEALWAPGDLSRFHADVAGCGECHAPFRGAIAGKCVGCHGEKRFAARSTPAVSTFHREAIRAGKACTGCHTEHRGALAQITVGAMENPHGEFVFRATGTGSCGACHEFGAGVKLLDNAIVRHLLEEGEGAHRLGRMGNCLACHVGGRREVGEDGDDD
jgi:hypothetical protein